MSQVVDLEATTRRFRRAWSMLAVTATAAAISIAAAAGGSSVWLRVALGALALLGCREAIRLRRSLTPMVVAGAVMLAIVPIDARLDRTVVAGVGAVLLLAGAECAHVARRLVTVVPVSSTRRDARAVATTTMVAAAAAIVTAMAARIERWSTAALVIALPLVAVALARWVPPGPTDGDAGRADSTGWSGSRP